MVESLLPVRAFPLLPCPSGGNPAALPGGVADAWRIVRTAERLGAVVQASPPNIGGALWHPFAPAPIDGLPPELTLHPRCLAHTTFTLQPGQIDASGLVPTIVGIVHTKKRAAFHCRLLADAYARGIRQIGIEATLSRITQPAPSADGFDELILLAQHLGLEIVALESQRTDDYRTVIRKARDCITEHGTLDDHIAITMYEEWVNIEKEALEKFATEQSPETRHTFMLLIHEARREAACWQMVPTYLRGIGYDLHRLAHDYHEAVHINVRDEYATMLAQTKVPLAIMGARHAIDLVGYPSTRDYRIIDIRDIALDYRELLPLPVSPGSPLATALRQIETDFGRTAALVVYDDLYSMYQTMIGVSSARYAASTTFNTVMNRALAIRPDLLLVRLASHEDGRKALPIDRHLTYLAMPMRTAVSIVFDVLRDVIDTCTTLA